MSNSVISWTVARQAPLPMGFSRQECWNGLPFPSPRDLLSPGIKPTELLSFLGFPGGTSCEEPACQRRRHKRLGFDLWVRKIPWRGIATHSSILAWRILWTEEPGGLQSMESQRVRHNWATQHAHSHLSESIFYLPKHTSCPKCDLNINCLCFLYLGEESCCREIEVVMGTQRFCLSNPNLGAKQQIWSAWYLNVKRQSFEDDAPGILKYMKNLLRIIFQQVLWSNWFNIHVWRQYVWLSVWGSSALWGNNIRRISRVQERKGMHLEIFI